MKFDISKSKLYGDIMSALSSFFKLGDDATETEVHAAIEGQKPLADQLSEARTEAVKELQAQLDMLKSEVEAQKTRIADLEKSAADAAAATAAKDARIAELQTSAAEQTATIDALKNQHKIEIDNLAGQLAIAKAGKLQENAPGGDDHATKMLKSSTGAPVVVARTSALESLLKSKN